MLTRRAFGALALSSVAWPALARAQTVSGVRLGVQTYSFRELMRPAGGDLADPVIAAMKECGLTECELWAPQIEPASTSGGGRPTPEEAQRTRDALRTWRLETPLDHFRSIGKKFNTAGAVSSMYVGVGSALLLIFFSPAVSGLETSMVPGADWAWFPLQNPGLVSIPLGFLAGIVGTFVGKPDNLDDLQAEMEVRSLTGVGTEAAVDH